MSTISGSNGSDTLQGTANDDTIDALSGGDIVSGEGGDDLVRGGAGSDTIYGDKGEGTAFGVDATPVVLSKANMEFNSSSSQFEAQVNDYAIYSNLATLADGTKISGKLILVGKSRSDLSVHLSFDEDYEIVINEAADGTSGDAGNASFRLEFFIPDDNDPKTGQTVAVNSTITVNDLDRSWAQNAESVTLEKNSFSSFSTSTDTSLAVTQTATQVVATGTELNDPTDTDAWFSAEFENREFVEFTLGSRTSPSGFTLSGEALPRPNVTTDIPAGDDTLYGGDGNDLLFGQGGVDVLDGNAGDDWIAGGGGADTFLSGSGEDTLVGGQGSDRFVITGADKQTIIGGEDIDGNDEDIIDLSQIDARVTHTGPEKGTIEHLDSGGNVIATANFSEIEQVICFTPGTLIATAAGEIPVEALRPGVKILTRDNGLQPLAWVGSKSLKQQQIIAAPKLAGVKIAAGALGPGTPARDMTVSPNHRVLVCSAENRVLFDEAEVLIAAKHLVGLPGITWQTSGPIRYIHLMLGVHEIILSDDCWTESFQPGDYSLRGVDTDQREELLSLFPDLRQTTNHYRAARTSLKQYEAKVALAAVAPKLHEANINGLGIGL